MLCYVMLCYVMLCYVMLCYVMLCYVVLCYVMICYVMFVKSCHLNSRTILHHIISFHTSHYFSAVHITVKVIKTTVYMIGESTIRPHHGSASTFQHGSS